MQQMEKYFGFRIHITDDLDPEEEMLVRTKAKEYVDLENVEIDKYHVYMHQMTIISQRSHFGFRGGLSDRIELINLDIHVNEKQRNSGEIRFMNYLIQTNVPGSGAKSRFSPTWIGYSIPSSYFENNDWFQNAIVVFVRKDIRAHHKKIKAVVTATPTKDFAENLHSRQMIDAATHLDLRFKKEVQLKLPLFVQSEIPAKRGNIVAYINNGNVGSMGEGATAFDFENKQSSIQTLRECLVAAQAKGNTEQAGNIEAAIEALESKKNSKAIEYLKKAGLWTLDKAEKVGMVVATEVVKNSLHP